MPARSPFGLSAFLGSAALSIALAGCTPTIGDECATSLDCSQAGDRLCDITQPEGYCTIFNCEPDTCPPGEGVCVAFDNNLDPACGPLDDSLWPRFERTFCMSVCEDDSDCRDDVGYACVGPSERSAVIIDAEPIGSKICIAKAIAASIDPTVVPGVCGPNAADAGAWTPYVPPGAGGAGGAGGGGGAGGAGG